jgi:hypothetical protein
MISYQIYLCVMLMIVCFISEQVMSCAGGKVSQKPFRQMRSWKVNNLRADVLNDHISATLCHMANISYRLGRKESIEATRQIVAKNDILAEAFERCVEHLKANDVDLESETFTIGPALTLDRKREEFTGEFGELTNMFLHRNYRAPFIVPDQV